VSHALVDFKKSWREYRRRDSWCLAGWFQGRGKRSKKGKTMLGRTSGRFIAGGVLAASLLSHPMTAHATNINISVASNFYISGAPLNSPIADVIAAFQSANPSYTVTVVQNGATGTLENQIISGNALGVDLFMAADTAHPLDLATMHPTLVVGSPFNYAIGTLAFWSNTLGVDVTCGPGGSCGYNLATYPKVAIADPSTAPYGVAANSVLTGRYGLMPPLSGNSLVDEYSNIDTTFTAVNNGTEKVGFIALSQICKAASYPTMGSALVYPPTDNTHSPIIFNYSPINQAAIRIAQTRTPPQNIELNAFVAFLSDHSTSPQSPMVQTLLYYCYSIP
jgi:molybdate transport system substrate-binding protein